MPKRCRYGSVPIFVIAIASEEPFSEVVSDNYIGML